MFDPKGFENSRADGFSVLEVVPNAEQQAPRLFIPLRHTCLTGEVAGPLADLRLKQTFLYTAEECDRVLEALYRFPLPGDAAVTGVTVRFGDTVLQAQLKEREQAEAEYAEAKQQGRQATLTTRESPDVFTLQIAGLKPDQEVVVETAYVQLARYEGSDWTLRVPLTTAPRYVREDEGDSRHTQGQPLAILRDPQHRFTLDLTFRKAQNIRSATHPLEIVSTEGGQRVSLAAGEVVPDRDCVLNWRAEQADQHPALHVLLHDDQATNQVYFLALLAPPRTRAGTALVPREAILLVDHSGSMEGAKWEAADWTVTRFLQGLTPQDTFALGLFHDRTQWFAPKPVPATPESVAAGIKYLRTSKDSGGTNLGVALEQALSLPRHSGERSRHALLVTDAEVSDEGRILRLASSEATQKERRRINVICIDAAPNSLLATELAERGGGVSRFLTSAPEQEDITTALDTLLEDWSAPVLTGLRLAINRPNAEAVERKVETQTGGSWIDIGDLPAGRATWVAGRALRGDSADLSFRLTTADGVEVAACRKDLEASEARRPAMKALFGAKRVLGLEWLTTAHYDNNDLKRQLERLGYDPNSALVDPHAKPKLYGENVQKDTKAALRGLLAREALDYGLASAETAFVAVNSTTGERVEQTVAVPNATPADWGPSWGGGVVARRLSIGAPAAAPMPPPGVVPSGGATFDFMASAPSRARGAGAKPGFVQSALDALGGVLGKAAKEFHVGSHAPAEIDAPAQAEEYDMMAETTPPRQAFTGVIFTGAPSFLNGEAVLFDTTQKPTPFADAGRLSRLEVAFPNGVPDQLDRDLLLLLYIDDPASPQVRVRLADLMQQGGVRPLNILHRSGQMVRLVLTDPSGAWAQQVPELVVALY